MTVCASWQYSNIFQFLVIFSKDTYDITHSLMLHLLESFPITELSTGRNSLLLSNIILLKGGGL